MPGAGPCQAGFDMGQCGAAARLALFSLKKRGENHFRSSECEKGAVVIEEGVA